MRFSSAIAFAGHQIHFCRYREAGALLRWLGDDLRGQRVLDVAGGDGYWAVVSAGQSRAGEGQLRRVSPAAAPSGRRPLSAGAVLGRGCRAVPGRGCGAVPRRGWGAVPARGCGAVRDPGRGARLSRDGGAVLGRGRRAIASHAPGGVPAAAA